MSFNSELKEFRMKCGLSTESAAQKTGLTEEEYDDREHNRLFINKPEMIGLLVALGMEVDKAIRIAFEPSYSSMSDMVKEYVDEINLVPFVSEDDDYYLFSIRDGGRAYEIEKRTVSNPLLALKDIRHLCSKKWVSIKHIKEFTRLLLLEFDP